MAETDDSLPGFARFRRVILDRGEATDTASDTPEAATVQAEHSTQVQPPGWPHEAGPFDEPPAEEVVLDEDELPWELRDAVPPTGD
ncbi:MULTISPECIES: hypothetical protein [unclassified Leifsonia]|uniref:hypothetical protein n=1 Tax=unclassified Leifsonia TaxID=2663824 RepID=UPI0006F8B865|nr:MULTISPECIES: hypothetical protein [unclassified Leifsonia]KQX07574.1 hypothetical protein ASC59_07480 [Leifsonia sp. Root1293]KRA11856.1 hypothetical protein ASD61_07480 [Leifsonia sp. Root60]